ncbi:MAG: (2Fe-2S)-binding protein [Alphaproteobacteria bacterium]|nr:MAG: (2Fe-2S)-binding protein [Alphaproteobacteria bacterium]
MLTLNDKEISVFEGETLATVILLSGGTACKLDKAGSPRGPFCNMGVCYDCIVTVIEPDFPNQRIKVRACMTTVKAGLCVFTAQEVSP